MPITPPYASVDFSGVGAEGSYKLDGGWGGRRLTVLVCYFVRACLLTCVHSVCVSTLCEPAY